MDWCRSDRRSRPGNGFGVEWTIAQRGAGRPASAILKKAIPVGILVLLAVAPTASAEVQLSIRGGRVTLVATDATVRQILTEWARVGKTNVVNVDRIPGGPLTLQLTDVPEPEALDLLLRSVSGYVAALRPVAVPGLSRYDRILVLPTATLPPAQGTPAPTRSTEPTPPVLHEPKGPRRPFTGNGDSDGPSVAPNAVPSR